MNESEYKRFLEAHGNYEEKKALEIISTIKRLHGWENHEIEYFPHKIITSDDKRTRIEFDLIMLVHMKRSKTAKTVGIEFKEVDIEKVISQALIRAPFVDYMYIASRSVPSLMKWHDFFLLTYYGIGWIIWSEKYVIPILKAQYSPSERDLSELLQRVIITELKNMPITVWIKEAMKE